MNIFTPESISAAVQIFILYLIIYTVLKYSKGTRFGQTLTGIGVISAILFGVSYVFHFDVLTKLFQFLILYLAVSSVVIFQPEIRRLLPAIGSFAFLNRNDSDGTVKVSPERLTECVTKLAARKTGAIIAIERGISLRAYIESGIGLDAIVSPELVQTIFTPPLPLHDGGMIISGGKIAAAHCLFPVSNKHELISLGMRHRAAVGLTEETDAVVIVVSEETGKVSIAYNGRLHRYQDKVAEKMLKRWITLSSVSKIRQQEKRIFESSLKLVRLFTSYLPSMRRKEDA